MDTGSEVEELQTKNILLRFHIAVTVCTAISASLSWVTQWKSSHSTVKLCVCVCLHSRLWLCLCLSEWETQWVLRRCGFRGH